MIYTVSFKSALCKLEYAGSCPRLSGRFSARSRGRHLPPSLSDAKAALAGVPCATDAYAINCGSERGAEVCVGDDILFVVGAVDYEKGRWGAHGGRTEQYGVLTGRVTHVSPGERSALDICTVDLSDGRQVQKHSSQLAVGGVWRKGWDDELQRDGVLAETMAQAEAAREEIELMRQAHVQVVRAEDAALRRLA